MAKKKEVKEKKVAEKVTKAKDKKNVIPQMIEVWDPTRGKMKLVSNPLYK